MNSSRLVLVFLVVGLLATNAGAGEDPITTRFRMPLLAHDWWAVTAYVDLDATAGLIDYECEPVTYDAHTGNDFALRDFVEQDEGRFVVAAADGIVIETADGYFDRETTAVSGVPANHVIVEHDDGTLTTYWHLRKWSVRVSPGETVLKGQPLGLVGSSGVSSGAHLHFGVWKDGVAHEPHTGTCRPGDSLWENQADHAFDSPVELFRAGMTTVNPAGSYAEQPPNVHHVKQEAGGTTHYFWFRLKHCHAGDQTRTIYRDPGGAIFRDAAVTCDTWHHRVTGRWTTVLPGTGSLGTWTIEFQLNGLTEELLSFTYDGADYKIPMAVGRSVAVTHGRAGGDLRGSDNDSDLEEFRIVTPPASGRVSLSGPRRHHFTYTPESGSQGQDTFTFEVEDAQGQVSQPATLTLDVSPVVANTLRLEGEDDHVTVPDNGSLNLDGGLTIEAWVRRTMGSAGRQVLVDRRNPDDTTGYSLAIRDDSTLQMQVGTGTAAVFADGTTPVPMDRWAHVAGTWDGLLLRLYVDGVDELSPVGFTGPIVYPGSYDTWLGRSRTPDDSFRGEIDEIRIWNVARTASELRTGATCAFLDVPPPATLRGWWRFQGDAMDGSGQGNDGSLVGPPFFRSADGALPLCDSEDTDSDGHSDNVDNCPLAPNDQADSDLDGIGDACDLCQGVSLASRADFDRDGVGDACDLCPFVADTDQDDGDTDGSGDLCDADPQDPGVGTPSGAIDVTMSHDGVTSQTTVSWSAEPLATKYQVIRGSLDEIRARFYGTCRSADDADPPDTTYIDGETPGPGEAFGYLVVGVGTDGKPGLAGLDSHGSQRDLRAKDCL